MKILFVMQETQSRYTKAGTQRVRRMRLKSNRHFKDGDTIDFLVIAIFKKNGST